MQCYLAWKSVNNPTNVSFGWDDALLLQRQIIDADEGDKDDTHNKLLTLLNSGELASRGLFEKDELEIVMEWLRDTSNPERQIMAATVIASSIALPAKKYTLNRSEICKAITNKENGCLQILLGFVKDGLIKLHNEISPDELEIGEEIGSGVAGSVYKAKYKGQPVAVKKFKGVLFEDFMKELSIMSIVEHKNLVKCYGGCTTSKDNMFIVQELMQANVSDILRTKAIKLDLGMKIRIALEIAKGMNFLHSHCNLIHRDLKSLNLLAVVKDDVDLIIKICDFGVSRVIDKRNTMTGNVGTVSWISPEIFEQRKYTEKADVYSFGIVLWELYTRKIPFSDIHSFSIPVAVIKGDRPTIPKDCPSPLKKLIRLCWDAKPTKRPVFSKIIEHLQKILEQLPQVARQQTEIDLGPLLKFKKTNSLFALRKSNLRKHTSSDDSHISSTTPTTTSTYESESPDSHDVNIESLSRQNSTINRELSQSTKHSSDTSPHTRTVTCKAPEKWAPPLAKLEITVNNYFSKLKQDLNRGTITVNEERYLLFRGHSLAVDFMKMVKESFNFDNEDQSLEFAQNFLYDLGYAIGKSDADHFLSTTKITDIVSRNNAGLVHIAYTGMAFVHLLEESTFESKVNDECLLYEYAYSFESESWLKKNKSNTDFCTCMMSAGYLAGWGEGATHSIKATAELQCKSKGDSKCLFVRADPINLESMAKKIGATGPIPRFLKNRADTTVPLKRTNSEIISQEPDNEHWFSKGFKTLFKKTKTKQEVKEVASPISPMKFNSKTFSSPELGAEEIDKRAEQELNSFFIDPTSATVEMASERCVLLRGDSLSYGFYDLVKGLFGSTKSSKYGPTMTDQFVCKFLFDLGRTIGISNLNWFSERISIGTNPIDRALALPVNMAYFGWCDLVFKSGLSAKEIQKSKDNFKIQCDVYNSFEASSWIKNKGKDDSSNLVCYMHAGYITGWFEASFKTSIIAIETQCRAQGHKHCSFTIGHRNNIKKIVPQTNTTTNLINTAMSTGVLPLLAKFKERRRDSTPLKGYVSDSTGMKRNKFKRYGSPVSRPRLRKEEIQK